jgi:ribonuclease E
MDDTQELVYGWMGFSPALLLEATNGSDNLLVRVVRPGEDPQAVVDEARQQLAAAGGRRRRRGRNGAESPSAESPAAPAQPASVAVEITPLPIGLQDEPLITVSVPSHTPSPRASREAAPQATPESTPVSTPEADDAGEPRRRRRRSSAAG